MDGSIIIIILKVVVNDLVLEVEKDVRRSTVGDREAAEDPADHALVILLLLLMFI